MAGKTLSPFSTILVFTAFILIGLSLIPVLDIQLSPSRSTNNLSVSYSWPNASARLIEQEVTSTLEGLFSSIKGLDDINSVTRSDTGSIQLSFKKNVNLDAIRFEIATLVRQVYHQFPPGVSYPQLSLGASGKIQQPVFTLTLNGSASPHQIRKYTEDNLVPKLLVLPGVNERIKNRKLRINLL